LVRDVVALACAKAVVDNAVIDGSVRACRSP
jgi:hypothetical protein